MSTQNEPAEQPSTDEVRLTCKRPTCKRTEFVDPGHPNFAYFKQLPEPRSAVCSSCAIAAFTF